MIISYVYITQMQGTRAYPKLELVESAVVNLHFPNNSKPIIYPAGHWNVTATVATGKLWQ